MVDETDDDHWFVISEGSAQPHNGGTDIGPPFEDLYAASERAARAYAEASARCADLESRDHRDELATERLILAQDQVVTARDRHVAATDRLDAARDRRSAAEYLSRSYRDELTGVLQRQAGRTELLHEIDRARREGHQLAVAFLDVEGLKSVNDTQGHLAGDLVLRAVGTALLGGLRSYDVTIRYGGDEFVCALPGADVPIARLRFVRVFEVLRRLSPDIAVTVGLTDLRPDDTLDTVIERADQDLYSRRASTHINLAVTEVTSTTVVDVTEQQQSPAE